MNQYTSTETNEIFCAISLAQQEIKVATKDSSNPFFKSSYANLKSIIESSRPSLCKNGLSVIQTVQQSNGGDYLVTILGHKSGQWISSCMKINPVKPDPQSLGSCITYLRRYAYAAIVGVYDGEDDDGNHASQAAQIERLATKDQLAILVKKIQQDDLVYEKIIKRYHVDDILNLTESQARDAIQFFTK